MPKIKGMNNPLRPRTTTAFYVQAGVSFGVSVVAASVAIIYLPVPHTPAVLEPVATALAQLA